MTETSKVALCECKRFKRDMRAYEVSKASKYQHHCKEILSPMRDKWMYRVRGVTFRIIDKVLNKEL